MRIAGRTARSAVLVAVLSSLPLTAHAADVVQTTGTITKVPGYPGDELGIRVSAQKTGENTATFWLRLENKQNHPINVLVCAMLNLNTKQDNVDVLNFTLSKGTALDGQQTWFCGYTSRSKGRRAPHAHFGCTRVTVPANGKADAFDTTARFDRPFEAADLGTVYVDVMKDCPTDASCAAMAGSNHYLAPDAGIKGEWSNIWADIGAYAPLTPPTPPPPPTSRPTVTGSWFQGNWVTMTLPQPYPARIEGTLTGAPAGAEVQIFHDGSPGQTFVVPAAAGEDPCLGGTLSIAEDYVIAEDPDALDRLEVRLPESACGSAAEGALMRFEADVSAREGAAFYEPGEYMFRTVHAFVNDTQPPILETVSAQPVPDASALEFQVSARDAATMATGATVRYWVEGLEREMPLTFASSSPDGQGASFHGFVNDLPPGASVDYQVEVFDEVGLKAAGPINTVLIPAVADVTRLTLHGGRFVVTARYRSEDGLAGVGMPIPVSDMSGLFWFFSPENPELIVKLIDACSVNERYWFFCSGLTDLAVDLHVRDNWTGEERVYVTQGGRGFLPVLDLDNLEACSATAR